MRFENKSVIITGGGGKIAKAYAIAFAKEGAKLSLPDIASADHVVKAIQDMGGTAITMKCDVTDEKSVTAMVDETARQFGNRICPELALLGSVTDGHAGDRDQCH